MSSRESSTGISLVLHTGMEFDHPSEMSREKTVGGD